MITDEFDWHFQPEWCHIARDALLMDKPELAESIAREYGVGSRFDTRYSLSPTTGTLVDVSPFLARDMNWYMSVYIMLDGRDKWPHYNTMPLSNITKKKYSFTGELQHLRIIK